MQQSFNQRPAMAPAVIGVVLIGVGAAALILREVGVNLFASIGAWGWPLFIIVPGLVLLAASLVPAPPRGIGFATAGAVVTTVGAILLYQSSTDHWESWAYAWALIPMAAGVATMLYGLLAQSRGMVVSGLWMAGIAAALFAIGAWFFEGLFAGEERLVDAGNWWPIAVIALGVLLALRAILVPTTPRAPVTATTAATPTPPATLATAADASVAPADQPPTAPAAPPAAPAV